MPFYKIDRTTEGGAELGAGLDAYRLGRYKLANALGHSQQMTSAEFATYFGIDPADAAAAKAELESDIQKLLSDDAGVNSAVVQMLNQFG